MVELRVLGEDLHIHVDVLEVDMVGDQSADCRIDDGIEGSGQLKEHGADVIDDTVDDEGHASHTERLVFFRHIEADDIIAAAAAACPQGQSHSGASQKAADDAGGEPIREDGHRRDRNEREEGGLGEDAVHRFEEERASELEKGQSQQWDIEDQVEDAGDVKAGGQCSRDWSKVRMIWEMPTVPPL